jgi:5-oxoprolinase (ATP-hydrolysing) subunit C
MTAHFTVVEAGLLTTIQDFGRYGWQRFGISTSGAMDPLALATANALVGNPAGTAALEITLAGPVLDCVGGDVRIALIGADFNLTIDGKPKACGESIDVRSGQRVAIGGARDGARAVLAVSGGFKITPQLGSFSTHARSALGGLNGGPVRQGDILPFARPGLPQAAHLRSASHESPLPEPPFRVLLGPQDDSFTPEAISAFLSATYKITPSSDRMGCRLEGPDVIHAKEAGIVSDGAVFGSVQIAGNGQPIILLADRQTTGGYPKIATVISADRPRLAQLRPGQQLRFQAIEEHEAVRLAKEFSWQIDHARDSLTEMSSTAHLTSEHLLANNLIDGMVSAFDG